jgi:hypothetical protein
MEGESAFRCASLRSVTLGNLRPHGATLWRGIDKCKHVGEQMIPTKATEVPVKSLLKLYSVTLLQ